MRIKHFYYCILYFLHIRALGKLSSVEASQQLRSNEVNEHLLNKNKIDTQFTGESNHDNSGQVHYSREKSNDESFTKNSTCHAPLPKIRENGVALRVMYIREENTPRIHVKPKVI